MTEPNNQVPGSTWAYWIRATFILGALLIGGSVALDAGNRSTLEIMTQPTAVGDPVTFRYDRKQNPAVEILKRNGKSYFLQTNEPLKLREYEARKVGTDESGTIQLYQTKKENDVVLVKIGENLFLRLVPKQ
jgi:hypothetical protein